MNEPTQAWTDAIDPSTIPDAVVWSELGKRRRARQVNAVPGSGRPPLLRPCPVCKLEFSARDMRPHVRACRKAAAKRELAEQRAARKQLRLAAKEAKRLREAAKQAGTV